MLHQRLSKVLAVLFLGVSGILYSCSRPQDSTCLVLEEEAAPEGTEAVKVPAQESEESTSAAVFYVHICGQVLHPGVYAMEEGSRLFQVVEQAGGFTPDAAMEYLNMAETIRDGMKIVVPGQTELEEALKEQGAYAAQGIYASGQAGFSDMEEISSDESPKVNLNTATKEQLMTLRGIGEAKASDIIQYRQEQGPFHRIEDIMEISGIKEAAFEKIKNNITV